MPRGAVRQMKQKLKKQKKQKQKMKLKQKRKLLPEGRWAEAETFAEDQVHFSFDQAAPPLKGEQERL